MNDNSTAAPISTHDHRHRTLRAAMSCKIALACLGLYLALIGPAPAVLQDFHDTRAVSVGDPSTDGKVEIVVEFEDSLWTALDWAAGTQLPDGSILVGAVSEAAHNFKVSLNVYEDDTPEVKAAEIAKKINQINPSPAPLKPVAQGKVALATGNVVVIAGKSNVYIKKFAIEEVEDEETGEIDAQSFNRYWSANGSHNRIDYSAHGGLKVNTADVEIKDPKRDGVVTVEVTTRNHFARQDHTEVCTRWSTSVLASDTALQKANKIRLAAPRQHNSLVVHPDIAPDPNAPNPRAYTIPGSIAGGTGTTLKFKSRNGWQIKVTSVRAGSSVDPDEEEEIKAKVAARSGLSGGGQGHVGLFPEHGTGVISVAGRATGSSHGGAPGYVRASVRGVEAIVPTEPGMDAGDVEDALAELLTVAGVGSEVMMTGPENPYRGIISDNRLIIIPDLVGQVALSLDSEDSGISCDHVAILLPRTDGAPLVEISKSAEGLVLNYQGSLQTITEPGSEWRWFADEEQSPLIVDGLRPWQLFRAVLDEVEYPEPPEPLAFAELQIEGGAIGGELAIAGALGGNVPADLLILLPWSTDPVTADAGGFSYQTTIPPFLLPGEISVGIMATAHDGRTAVYSGRLGVSQP